MTQRQEATPTKEYFVFDRETGEMVCPFEDAPKVLWDGLLDRATGDDGYIATEEELDALIYHPELTKGYEVRERLIDQKGRTAEYRHVIGDAAPVEDRGWRDRVGRSKATLTDMLVAARKEQFRRTQADNERRASRQAIEHAERYREGLSELDAMEAKNRLKSRIMAMEDKAVRGEWMARYPELFDPQAADAMAAEDRAREQAELWEKAGGPGIVLGATLGGPSPAPTNPDE